MAINNPLVPGDPFSYDLKWLVRKTKTIASQLDGIMEDLPTDEHIQELVQTLVDQLISSGLISSEVIKTLYVYNVKDYGAEGDGQTDDYAAIMAAYADAVENAGILYFPPGDYLTTRSLVFSDPCDVSMEGYINYKLYGPAVTLGSSGASFELARQNWKIRGDSSQNAGTVGLYARNCNICNLFIDDVRGFESGVVFEGNGAGFQNNNVIIGTVDDYVTGLTLVSKNSGWCNENLFLGGRFHAPSSHNWTATAIKLYSEYSNLLNNNVFIKPNCEGNEVAIDLANASYNAFINVRSEAVTEAVKLRNDQCTSNTIKIGYGNLNDPAYGALNTLENMRKREELLKEFTTFHFDDMARNACCNNSNGSIRNLRLFFGSELPPYSADLRYTLDADNNAIFTSSRNIVAAFDVRPQKNKLLIIKSVFASGATRAVVSFFDSDGNNITETPEHFAEQSWTAQTVNNASIFRIGSNIPEAVVVIPENAARMFVGVQTQGNTALQSIEIQTNAMASLIESEPIITVQPTINGVTIGQTAHGVNGELWVWTGSAWRTVTTS